MSFGHAPTSMALKVLGTKNSNTARTGWHSVDLIGLRQMRIKSSFFFLESRLMHVSGELAK